MTVAGVLAVAVSATDAGTLDRVLVATLALLALSSFDAVSPLPAAARELSATLAAGRRVLELTDREPRVQRSGRRRCRPPPPRAGRRARGRDRPLPGRRAAGARGVDLRLDPGRRVALVGPSGAGKTTVTNLLLRFLDPEAGRVTIAGRDAARVPAGGRAQARSRSRARRRTSSTRRSARTSGSHGRRRPTRSSKPRSDARGSASGWRSLPDGLDTLVGEDGTRLSGGQRQRLTLARALLADAPVLVLDEPTAHLDPATAQALMDDVLDAAGERTVLLITHRPEGLDQMDEVVTLDAGTRV